MSLFSGGGGLDIAFHEIGFDIKQMVEIEEKYVKSLRENSKPGCLLEGSDAISIDIRDYKPAPGLKVDFIIGGPPCQTFSAAGRRAAGVSGISDPGGTLFEEYVRVLDTLKPKGFLFENVYGIVGAQEGKAWKAIQEAFKGVGYTIYYRILDTADYGVPQHRERLFIVGLREGEFLFPYPTHGPDSIGREPYYSAIEAVEAADNSGVAKSLGGQYGHLLKDIPSGLNYSFYTEKMGHPKPVFGWRSKFSDFLYKADPDTPVRTIKAQGGQYTGPFSWENRPFSVDELKRLQTFPDEYKLLGNRQVCIEQIGNSVPPQMGRMLALSILNQVFGVQLPFGMHYMPQGKQLGFRKRKHQLTDVYQMKAREAIERLYEGQTKSAPIKESGVEVRYLSPKFKWSKSRIAPSIRLKITYELSSDAWEIRAAMTEDDAEVDSYMIELRSSNKVGWVLPTQKVRLIACGQREEIFTALWKAFEEMISQLTGIADLVQLNGYYQYTPNLAATISLLRPEPNQVYWQALRMIVQGVGVGQQMSEKQFAILFSLSIEDIRNSFEKLRAMGYEIRNNNTNPQIADGEYLIPYAFPTLNPRSVQLRKSLRAIGE